MHCESSLFTYCLYRSHHRTYKGAPSVGIQIPLPQIISKEIEMSRKSLFSFLFVAVLASVCALYAQEGLQQQVGQLKESMAKNKQALAQYTWVETVTISLKGEEKKQQHYQVQMGPDGKPQKTSLDSAPAAQPQDSGGRGGRLRQRVVEKKKEEYED